MNEEKAILELELELDLTLSRNVYQWIQRADPKQSIHFSTKTTILLLRYIIIIYIYSIIYDYILYIITIIYYYY